MEFKYVKNKDWYIPDIQCSSNSKKENIGKYGRMRERFLKEHKHSLYDHLVASEKLAAHLSNIDKEARNYLHQLIKDLAEQEDVDEKLKVKNQIEWMQKMNNIKNRAEEIVINELIYS